MVYGMEVHRLVKAVKRLDVSDFLAVLAVSQNVNFYLTLNDYLIIIIRGLATQQQ